MGEANRYLLFYNNKWMSTSEDIVKLYEEILIQEGINLHLDRKECQLCHQEL